MSDLTQFWIQRDLNNIAHRAALEAIDRLGKCLPCTITGVAGQIVTVAFNRLNTKPWTLQPLTVPVANSPYDYVPYQVGDTGVVRPVDVYIGNISGLGGNVPSSQRAMNLSALVFEPVGKKSFTAANANARIIQGPDGWISQTTEGTPCSIVGNQQGITLTFGSTQIVMNSTTITMSAGGQTVTLNSSGFNIGGILFGTHVHSGVTTGSDDSGGPVS